MRLRVSEVRQYPVPHVLRHEPARLGDLLSAAAVIRADDLAHVLGVEASGERGRADEIAEHDGELAALGGTFGASGQSRCRGGRRFGCGLSEDVAALEAELR